MFFEINYTARSVPDSDQSLISAGGATRSREGGAAWTPESGASVCLVKERHRSGSGKVERMAPALKPHNSVTDTP